MIDIRTERFESRAGVFEPTPGHPYRLVDLEPLRDRLIVQPLAVSARSITGNIILAETSHQRERPQHGVVLAVGHGLRSREGQLLPMQARVGDLVFYGKYSGQEFEIGGVRVLNMSESEVFAVLAAGRFTLVLHDDAKDSHLLGDFCDLCQAPAEADAKAALSLMREQLIGGGIAPVEG